MRVSGEKQEALLAAARRYTEVVQQLQGPTDDRLLPGAETANQAFQAAVMALQEIPGANVQFIIVGMGVAFGNLLAAQTPDGSGHAMALFLKAAHRTEAIERRGG